MRVGIDIEETEKFVKITQTFLNKYFSKQEIEYCKQKSKPEQHFAGIFCVKEAFLKTQTNRFIDLKTVEVVHNSEGRPELKDKPDYSVSISHSNRNAVGIVIKT